MGSPYPHISLRLDRVLMKTQVQPSSDLDQLVAALNSSRYTSGSTHSFYLYPSRFSPEIAQTIITLFSEPGDSVLDPFMGGGTSIIEGMMLGRRMVGIDLNALAHFVVSVRTCPLSDTDADALRSWAGAKARRDRICAPYDERVLNLPADVQQFFAREIAAAQELRFPRQEAFARCALLRLGQWALDCRDAKAPGASLLRPKLPELVNEMLDGLVEFTDRCGIAGISKREIPSRRQLFCGNSAEVARLDSFPSSKVRLVFTSPPYPRVHVLYHRWQVRSRKETPAPYWIADVPDGHFASHYTGGSRTPTGEQRYFSMIRDVFTTIRPRLADDAVVAQLIGFADVRAQLPLYLGAMKAAGFQEWSPAAFEQRLWRKVPNRKWYAKLHGADAASSELLLFHRPGHARR